MFFLENIWLILFVAWGLPLTFYRSKFRKIVYQTDSWTINIKPYFWKELKALFGNIYPDDSNYLKRRNFYRFYLIIYLLLFVSYLTFHKNNTMTEIKIGSNIPSFSLPDQNGNLFDINSVLGKKNLVIYFYPKDDSPGCTAQACSFQDQFEVFKEADAVIIGISGQSVESHKEFALKHRLTFTLLSDEGNKIRKQFGVPTNLFGFIPGRVTYVADKTGKVIYIFNSQTQATKHVDEAMRILLEKVN
jgi:thioredoxin-dependent peroxiredoxin